MIRRYRASDLPELRRICLLTGNAGGDATGLYSDDGLLPDIFLEPYVTFLPDTAWVLDLGDGPVGYLVGALDTAAFASVWRESWVPELARRHPVVPAAELWLLEWEPTPVDGYPAHLHIDLLPAAQGGGWGRALLRELGAAAVAEGVPGIHLGMSADNAGALAFYERLGFGVLRAEADVLVLGIAPAGLL